MDRADSQRDPPIAGTRHAGQARRTYPSQRPGGPYVHGGMVGVPHFAGGGMVPFWAGENGPELAHFAGGGTALLSHEGLYAAPPMAYISPNNVVSNEYGGHTFNIAVTGGNREEIRAVFAD
ncbi:MAG: hypothetical protein M3451_10220, partial [Chloroflexota bacterium]|nr:hypothetical protein [Chloroflexota bacterium]